MQIEQEPHLFADGFMFLEAPKWHDGQLWVSDVFDHKVYALSADGQRERIDRGAEPPVGTRHSCRTAP